MSTPSTVYSKPSAPREIIGKIDEHDFFTVQVLPVALSCEDEFLTKITIDRRIWYRYELV